jgi:hypothetical protein
MQRQTRRSLHQPIPKPRERCPLAITVQRADDRHPARRCSQGIVMAHLAGEIQIDLPGNRIIEQITAGARATGNRSRIAFDRPGDQKMIQSKPALDALDQLGTRGWRNTSDSSLTDARWRGGKNVQVESRLLIGVSRSQGTNHGIDS